MTKVTTMGTATLYHGNDDTQKQFSQSQKDFVTLLVEC